MNTITPKQSEAILNAAKACKEHGLSFINLYEAYPHAVKNGWDEYIYTCAPTLPDNTSYRYLGIVRPDGDYCLPFN